MQVGDVPLDGDAATALLRSRAPHPSLAPHAQLPDDTRLWAALQRASGGTWAGCVFDVDRIVDVLDAGMKVARRRCDVEDDASNETVSNESRRRLSRATERFVALPDDWDTLVNTTTCTSYLARDHVRPRSAPDRSGRRFSRRSASKKSGPPA